jgi:hypothetical protein
MSSNGWRMISVDDGPGNAFLAQQAEVADAVRMRKGQDKGTKPPSSKGEPDGRKQRVIVIEQSNPESSTFQLNPTVVYLSLSIRPSVSRLGIMPAVC